MGVIGGKLKKRNRISITPYRHRIFRAGCVRIKNINKQIYSCQKWGKIFSATKLTLTLMMKAFFTEFSLELN